ncbi:carboxypeptidase-like regulatory domain-containing protein [Crocinitomix algicola]|uniref:carboxypeptidase-like regulatory domain-containing protein n=1 Tax=Crocinitomix algicola TaxID=1740263 RepID=UPI000834C813|nr:carboxypeptidase-like regulatory domain-containing protein [Crocinitomix algicola]
MKKGRILLMVALGIAQLVGAQVGLGRISGFVYEKTDSTTTIPITRLWIETEAGKMNARSDFDGSYKIDAIKPGTYNLYAAEMGHDSTMIAGVVVRPDGITTVDVYMSDENVLGVVILDFSAIKIEKDIQKITILQEDIAKSPFIRDPKGLLAGSSSDIQQPEGSDNIIIRGSRPGDAIYYIDGVKATDMSSVPGVSIQGLQAYTGGIPAKYGDTTGGVVVLETKGYFDLYYAWKARN